jgi:rhamnulokinase
MNKSLYIAVDLGAGSGRVFLAGVAPDELLLEEVRRFHYAPREIGGLLRWDFAHIFAEIKSGLRDAGARAKQLGRTVYSFGVDTWGVDYGLLDAAGNLLEDPVCYRDPRTAGVMEQAFAKVSREEIFARTGIQFMPLNTLFQLYAHAQAGLPSNAAKLLLMPDLVNFFLTGRAVCEFTNATTTQMLNAETGVWDAELLERLSLPIHLLPEIVPAGTDLGPLLPKLAEESGLEGVRVIAPATHDTGSAVLGAPLTEGWAFISSGTWSLVGVELPQPIINTEVARENCTNEGGAFGATRFLKNVMGLWLLEECRREWQAQGREVSYNALLQDLDASQPSPPLDPDDPRLFNPRSMLAAIGEQLGDAMPDDPPAVAKIILDALARRYAEVLRRIENLKRRKIYGVQIVGGGCRNAYLNQATANATGLPVRAGPVEATVTGNILAQALAAGRFKSLREARRHVAQNIEMQEFEPNGRQGDDRSASVPAGKRRECVATGGDDTQL